MADLTARLEGIGVLGPGLDGWTASAAVLSGASTYIAQPTVLPMPEGLPPAERRRLGRVVKLALAVGQQAVAKAGADPTALPSVFSSSGGDGHNCHEICEALARDEKSISPTRFHNSVHNAAAGYWSIATGCKASSNALCAFDASFGAGLLESVTQVVVDRTRVLLVAYDAQYPEPLFAKRPIPEAFGVALVLAPDTGPANGIARISLAFSDSPADALSDRTLESLRAAIPSARSLPLLQRIALGRSGPVHIDYLGSTTLAVEIHPCS
jgi:hypothetical protein